MNGIIKHEYMNDNEIVPTKPNGNADKEGRTQPMIKDKYDFDVIAILISVILTMTPIII